MALSSTSTSSANSLALLLSTWLATDTIAIQSADALCGVLNQLQIIRRLSSQEQDEPQNSSAALNRMTLRIGSLLASRSPTAHSLGARLAISTAQQSEAILLSHGAGWLTAALTILGRCVSQNPCSSSVAPVVSLALHIFERGSQWPEFSRENCDSKALLGLTRSLIALSGDEIGDFETRSVALQALSSLLPRYSTTLRPVASQLQTLALSQLLHPVGIVSKHATSLLTSLYRLSGKVDATVAWSTTIKGAIGTVEMVLDTLVSPTWKESAIYSDDNTDNQRLAPLDIPLQTLLSSNIGTDVEREQLPINQISLLLKRIESLVRLLVTMLSEPTERPVSVPIGELCRLAWRLLSIGKAEIKSRPDLSWKSAWDCLGASMMLRSMGCRLVSQIAQTTSNAFIPFSSPTLLMIASAIESANKLESGGLDTSVLYATYARIVLSSASNPDTIKSSLEPIVKAILRDLKQICGRDSQSASGVDSNNVSSRKAKPRAKKYESDQVWGRGVVVDQTALVKGQRALNTLELLISSVPHFFPSPHLSILIRHVVSLASHPSFFSPLSSVSASANTSLAGLSASSSSSPELAFASQPSLRPALLRCLINCIPLQKTSAQSAMGLNLSESMISILSQVLVSTDNCTGEMIDLAHRGLHEIGLVIRPRVPPISLTQAQSRAEEDAELDEEDDSEDEERMETDAPLAQAMIPEQTQHRLTSQNTSLPTLAPTTPHPKGFTAPTPSALEPSRTHPLALSQNVLRPSSTSVSEVPVSTIHPSVPLSLVTEAEVVKPSAIIDQLTKEWMAPGKRKSDDSASSSSRQPQKQKQARRSDGVDKRHQEANDSDESEIPQLDLEESESEDGSGEET